MTKRRVIQVVVFLLLGAIVNVAVAWGCAIWITPLEHSTVYVAGEPARWSYEYSSAWGSVRIKSSPMNEFDVLTREGESQRYVVPRWSRISTMAQSENVLMEDGRGWPVISLTGALEPNSNESREWGEWVRLSNGKIVYVQGTWRNLLSVRIKDGVAPEEITILPLFPIWPGFAINTIFYAAILWLLFFAPGMMRRTIRRKRGLCPACAYPVGTSEVCAECGNAVVSRGVTVGRRV